LEIPCLTSGACLKFKDKFDAVKEEITAYAELANKLGASYIRVLGDLEPAPGGEVDDEYVAECLRKLVPVAEQNNVTLLVETNGVYSDTARLAKVLDSVKSRKVAALWDMHHPYRYNNEAPETTVANLGEYIKYIQVKDSVMREDGTVEYRIMGTGDIPVKAMIEALDTINYNGYISLEWVKRWARDLSDAGIVIPQFAEYMAPYKKKHKHPLQTSMRGDGQYPWPKERILNYTFPDILDRICDQFPNQYAFRYTELDYTRTYPEFRDDVDTFARALLAMGVKKGDHVAIWATNVPQWYITFWATTKIGAVLVTMNTEYRIHEAEYLLRQSDTNTLVMIDGYRDSNYNEIINELCPELKDNTPGSPLHAKRLPLLRNVITVGFSTPGALTWEEAITYAEKTPIEEVHRMQAAIDVNDVCNMQYTSGTTGFPKGVMLTHYNIVNDGKSIGDGMDLSTADRMMIQVPMFHCFGMVLAMTATMTHGGTILPIPYFSPKSSLACINDEHITAFHGVPTMFIAMLSHPDFEKTDFSHMRTGIMAGSPCPIAVMRDVVDKMHMPEIVIVYGQTEAAPGCTMSRTTDSLEVRVTTVGRAFPEVECKIVDPETGEDCPDEV
ncbi:MAG: AMP-binding protein, partial [Clostridia bacterium]|nr:AMP-binding protein [Clostridia bacterium]